MNKDVILAVSDLSVRYLSTDVNIEDITFEINRGRVLGLVGESGSGKSTICNVILGLLDSAAVQISGSVRLQDKEILPLFWDGREKINGKEIGVILQNPMAAFNPCMRIQGHFIETLCTHLLCSKRNAILYGIELLRKVGLPDGHRVMRSYPFQLSGGMLQRVMVAIAISLNPALIIADEPTTALDTGNQAIVMDLLSFVMREYKPAMLLVSHDMGVVEALADDIVVMKDGCILEQGAKTKVLYEPQVGYTKELLASAGLMEAADCLKSGM
jgi:ABC-type dipeptide/oligopeptide/nickel transport system ATPase component